MINDHNIYIYIYTYIHTYNNVMCLTSKLNYMNKYQSLIMVILNKDYMQL